MSRRLLVVVVLALLVGGAITADGAVDERTEDPPVPVVDASVFPISASPGSLSSTWFCAGGTGDDEEFADHRIRIANPTELDVSVDVTTFGGDVAAPAVTVDPEDLDDGGDAAAGSGDEASDADESDGEASEPEASTPDPVVETLDVPPRASISLRLKDRVQAPVVSALVESSIGGIVVEHAVSSIHGTDAKPCVTAAAPEWHFAWGDTTVDARELLVLFNPFPQDAIVDGRFSTEDGVREPARFDGFVVPARGTVAVDLGDDVTRRQEVAATITARSGRIVVDRVLRVDRDGDRGLTVQSGVPEPQRTWVYPDGFASEAVREEYVVYNPTDQVAEVEIEFILDDPETNGVPEPVDLSLAPGTHQRVVVNDDDRVPAGVAHAAVVRSANDVGVVAERVLFASGESRRGISVTTGSPVEAEQWTFAVGATSDVVDEWLTLLNLDAQVLASIEVFALADGQLLPVADLQGIELGPGERRSIRLGEHITRAELPLVVRASEPVVAERGLYRIGADDRGTSNAVGIPGPDGLRVPGDALQAVPDDLDVGDLDEPVDDDVTPAPDDVELPEPDETIVIDDPDAEADGPSTTTTTTAPSSDDPTTTADTGGVPSTEP